MALTAVLIPGVLSITGAILSRREPVEGPAAAKSQQ